MPITTPISQKAVDSNKEVFLVMGEGQAYALFKFGEGLTYKLARWLNALEQK